MDIGFNSRFLIEILSNLESDEINLHMSTPNRAGIIIPSSNEENKNEDLMMLVMPVMINS
jgi:DNA polymerase-3 subunit beta